MGRIREATIADAAAIGRVHVQSWVETYRGILPDPFLGQVAQEDREPVWRRWLTEYAGQNFVYVAENAAGEVVGFASGGAERGKTPGYDGELYALYLLQRGQKEGLGRGLMEAVARRLLKEGYHSLLVWVLADNPARHFYAHLGGKQVAEQPIEIGGTTLIEIAYGWPALEAMVG
ncbi:MAG: GNAT family N-acetyltransferase [Chloroflexi bacterium]|nr:MAG: GNAT family N-acetyltransferase [Chloroflexota bacterium]